MGCYVGDCAQDSSHVCWPSTLLLHWKQIRLLEPFHQCRSRSILGFKWQDHLLNKEVLKRASLPSIESVLLQVLLHWAGHFTRMEDVCMAKAVFFSTLHEGKRNCCAPRKRNKGQLKRQLVQTGISHRSWQQEATDWDNWRSSVRKASCVFKAERHKAAKEERRRQKEHAASLPSSSQTFVYTKCGTGSASRIGLYSHQWLCKNWPSTFPTILICEEWAIIIIISLNIQKQNEYLLLDTYKYSNMNKYCLLDKAKVKGTKRKVRKMALTYSL